MGSLLSQISAVVAMNIRSLPKRLWMSLAMVIASAVVVAILLAFLAMARGFEATLEGAGSDNVAIFTRSGSASEINSTVTREQVNLVGDAPGVLKEGNTPQVSAELYVILDGIKKSSQTEANLPLRGLDVTGVGMRKGFEIQQGRMFTPGTNEMVVGAGVASQFEGFSVGSELRFGKNVWTVVGIFGTGGNVFESEAWADAKVIQSLYNRGSSYQTIRARIESSASIDAIRDYIAQDPRLNLDVETEASFFAEQGKQLRYMAFFGLFISVVMALGALAGALNTMYTSVAERTGEIATLRALGFSNLSAFAGTLAEAMLLAAAGGLLGALAAFLLFDGMSASTLGGSFTQVVFSFELSTDLVARGMVMALVIGLLSGLFPAWRASRIPVVAAFRANG
ncbi:ABC transporter permease [Biformimicrobium ophioploci]|uniref:ABC transporter permease n=1 Tax=Biformimicrobium ophioploci TaxID=3036711 RepID=A0ABQ6LYB9_9GAMM|nr:ABC transporter permease [Microbulbifer sp. NKW57]GMG87046.1 ABC transporter permease [Microbulbifer sp. NKW57]